MATMMVTPNTMSAWSSCNGETGPSETQLPLIQLMSRESSNENLHVVRNRANFLEIGLICGERFVRDTGLLFHGLVALDHLLRVRCVSNSSAVDDDDLSFGFMVQLHLTQMWASL